MGVYDEIRWECPGCKADNLAQSKSGDCVLAVYPMDDVPLCVAMDANRHSLRCHNCHCAYQFSHKVAMRIVKREEQPE